MKLDILAFAAHPDDVEISAGGTILKHIANRKKCGIIDFTKGELGTRGTAETRKTESENATKLLGISVRENLEMADGFFSYNEENIKKIIVKIREYKPDVVLATAPSDRHPDHGRAAKMITDACFYSGLIKIETGQEAWRPKNVFHYIQDEHHEPDFVIDISDFFEKKMQVLNCYPTQFYNPNSAEPVTPISTEEFLTFIEARCSYLARSINTKYAEGFLRTRISGVNFFEDLI